MTDQHELAQKPTITSTVMDGDDLIKRFDIAMLEFQEVLGNRLRLIQQTSGTKMEVDIELSTYVIPGFHYRIHAENQQIFNIFVGANFKRLFFITRLQTTPENAKEVFKFTFGGAEKAGWEMNYEEIGEKEVSIWATQMCTAPVVTGYDTEPMKPRVTEDGAFWAIDIGLMVQSMIRTSQRFNIAPSAHYPEPL